MIMQVAFISVAHTYFPKQNQPPEVLCKNSVLKIFANFTGIHLYWVSFFNLNKKRLRYWFFPVKFAKFLRAPILKNNCKRLLLYSISKRMKIIIEFKFKVCLKHQAEVASKSKDLFENNCFILPERNLNISKIIEKYLWESLYLVCFSKP